MSGRDYRRGGLVGGRRALEDAPPLRSPHIVIGVGFLTLIAGALAAGFDLRLAEWRGPGLVIASAVSSALAALILGIVLSSPALLDAARRRARASPAVGSMVGCLLALAPLLWAAAFTWPALHALAPLGPPLTALEAALLAARYDTPASPTQARVLLGLLVAGLLLQGPVGALVPPLDYGIDDLPATPLPPEYNPVLVTHHRCLRGSQVALVAGGIGLLTAALLRPRRARG